MIIHGGSNKVLTSSEVARLLNVHVNTVRRWEDKGLIQSRRIGPRGDRLFSQQDINKFLEESRRKTKEVSNSNKE